MRLTFNTVYFSRNGEVCGPVVPTQFGLWTDGQHTWTDNGICVSGAGNDRDLIAVYTPPAPAAFATSA